MSKKRGKEGLEKMETVEHEVEKISKDEVREALKRMKKGKAVCLDDRLVEVWKCQGERAVELLTKQLNMICSQTVCCCLI